MKLNAALDALRALPKPDMDDATFLVGQLEEGALRMVAFPRKRCRGVRCPFTNPQDFYSCGCKCEPVALAMRLLALARTDFGVAQGEPLTLWHKLTCASCGCDFKDRRPAARYCPRCTGELPSLRKQNKRKRGR